jgi:hypothetical protein
LTDCGQHHHDPPSSPPGGPERPRRQPWRVPLRFLGWFIGFSGLYAMGSVCPFCGRPGCPTGAASAGLVGLVFASLMQWGRAFRAFLARLAQR